MYYGHFGLNQAPFKITPNTEFFFSGGNRGPVLEALVYAVANGEGIIKVTGEVGSGKTMLCHMLQTRLPAHIDTVYIANPSVSPEEILQAIAYELQLSVARDAPRLQVMQFLQDDLLRRYADGRRVVVFVEEAQSMPLATLEEIRLLSNLETRNDKLLQIVLFGQPELDENLSRPNIRQLRERITHSFRLQPLAPGEIREYLMFRMRAAGYRGPDLFSQSVVNYISRASQGLTRRVNLIADKALLAAFSENTHTVRTKHVDAAVRDSEFSHHAGRRIEPRFWWGAGLILAGAALGITAHMLAQDTLRQAPAPPAQPLAADQPAAMQQSTPRIAADTSHTMLPATAPSVEATPPTAWVAPADATAAKPIVETPLTAPRDAVIPAATGAKSPAEKPLPPAEDALEARFEATREWLAAQPEGTYSIQIMGTDDATQLKQHLNVLSKSIEMNKIFVYRTLAKEKPSLTVLYGSYSDRRAAQQALKELPASLKAHRPLLRTVQGILVELQRHQRSENGREHEILTRMA